MSKAFQLDYAQGGRTWSVPAIIAIILGVCSGPITIVLVRLTGIAYGISIVGGTISVIVGLLFVVYCIWAFAKSYGRAQVRGSGLALIGLIATILWSICLVCLFCYIDSQLN